MALPKRSASALLAVSLFATACGGGAAETPVESAGTVPPGVPLTVAPTSALAAPQDSATEALAFEEPSAEDVAAQAALEAERAEKVAAAKAKLAEERERAAELVGQQPAADTAPEADAETEPDAETEADEIEEEPVPLSVTDIAPLASFSLEGGVVVASPDNVSAEVVERRDSWLASLAEEDRASISTLHVLPAADPADNAEPWEVIPDQTSGFNIVYLRLA